MTHLALDSQDASPEEVARRFQWAMQSGNPAWLWPEVQAEDWRAALGEIERSVRGVLSGRPTLEPLDGDPEAMGLACYTSGTGPLLGWWREQGLLAASGPVAAVLDLHLRHNRLRSARMEAAAVALIQALLEHEIPVTVLKGAHTGRAYFPDPATRPASDVDLLVRGEDAGRAEQLIARAGYRMQSRGARESSWRPASAPNEPRSLKLAHADDPWSIDLHSSLDLFVSAGAPLANLEADDPMSGREGWTPCPGATVVDQPLLLVHLAVHAGSGFQNLTLLRLVELGLVIRHDVASGTLLWDAFLAAGQRTRSLGFAYPALRLCEDLTPGTVPDFVLDRCALSAPAAVKRVLSRLAPATAQRIDRASVSEHFMWTSGWGGRLQQLAFDLAPPVGSWRKLWAIYDKRARRLIHGRISQ